MSDRVLNADVRLLDGHFYADDPWPHFRWLRENAPIYWDPSCELWGVALHEDIMSISKRPELFSSEIHGSRPDAPPIPSMINRDPPRHRIQRNLVNKGFTPRRVQALEGRMRSICGQLVDDVLARGECDFAQEIAAPLPMHIIGDLLGIDPADREDLRRWSDDLTAGAHSTAGPDAAAASAAAFAEYAAYNGKVVADRRSSPGGEDLMSVLVHAEIDGERLDEALLLHESLLLLIGGIETTRNVISGGMEMLIRHPEQYRWLAGHPKAIPVAVEEMLRWVTPIVNMNRTAVRDVELRGQSVKAGDKLLLLYPSGNRDERVFDQPDRFDIRRSPNPHVAFGGFGEHFCLGASLARLELRVMFEELLARMPELELAADTLPVVPSSFVRGISSMPVRFEARGA